jgi:ribosomal protein L11 methylase PrmA
VRVGDHEPAGTDAVVVPRRDPASFRDPTGFVYRRGERLFRQVHEAHAAEWQQFEGSGLYRRLVERGWLVAHAPVAPALAFDERAWRVLEVEQVDFVSYPYEWTFGQLKDAALLTLEAQAAAVEADMTLKDASAYNVLFDGSRPVLIDALSFERRTEDEPWVAYRQFCQHFLAPLALMAQRDVRIGLLLRDFIDGVPLDLAADLLPVSSRVRLGLGTHLHLHARAQRQHAADPDRGGSGRPVRLSRARLEALVESLHATVAGLRWEPRGTEWSDYGETTSYSPTAAAAKRQLVQRFLAKTDGQWIWDLGANTGVFSALAAESGRRVVALDADHAASEQHYRSLRRSDSPHILPLVMDLANPSPALGWAHRERRSLAERANADVLIALALVHHLAIGNNVPLAQLSSFLAELGRQLIIEFVPKSDPRVRAMLARRRDVFAEYSLDGLKTAFAARWRLAEEERIEDSERTLLRFVRVDQAA